MKKNNTRETAISALASLLPEGMKDAARPPIPISTWKPTAITIVYRNTPCKCGIAHWDINPLLLLTETDKNGSTRSTSSGYPGKDPLPISTTHVDLPQVPFCSSCLDITNPESINAAFGKQRAINLNDTEAEILSLIEQSDTPVDPTLEKSNA